MVIEAGWRDLFEEEVVRKGRTILRQYLQLLGIPPSRSYLNSCSPLMTCIPCSYCSLVDFSPMFAKWPLTDITEGAVGCLVLFEGRLSLQSRCGEATAAILVEYWYTSECTSGIKKLLSKRVTLQRGAG